MNVKGIKGRAAGVFLRKRELWFYIIMYTLFLVTATFFMGKVRHDDGVWRHHLGNTSWSWSCGCLSRTSIAPATHVAATTTQRHLDDSGSVRVLGKEGTHDKDE